MRQTFVGKRVSLEEQGHAAIVPGDAVKVLQHDGQSERVT